MSVAFNKLVSRVGLATWLVVLCAWPCGAGKYFERDGAAIGGYDPVAYFTEMKPVKGAADFHASYEGSTFYFVSAAHRDAFAANPERFAPQYGGFCAYGAARGYKAAIEPAAFTVVGEKLYLNYSKGVRALWILDIPGNIKKADQNWPDVRKSSDVAQ
jgi:YHS domain-containing protein